VASSDNVPPERQFRGSAKNTIKGMSDMKKIKSKLVTIVTDNVLLVKYSEASSCANAASKER
jgi:hypothetical protein